MLGFLGGTGEEGKGLAFRLALAGESVMIGSRDAAPMLLEGLKRLEYRGYDSAGIATLTDGDINEVKCEGRVDALEKEILKHNLRGEIGIGHV